MPADSTATSVPAPIAIPTSAVASAGASFTPSPTIADLPAARLEPPDRGRLVGRQHLRPRPRRCPSRRATESATAWLSPVIIATRTPSAWSCATASATRAGSRPRARARRRRGRRRRRAGPSARPPPRLGRRRVGRSSPSSASSRGPPTATDRPSTAAAGAPAGQRLEAGRRRRLDAARAGASHDRPRERMLGVGLDRGGERGAARRPSRRPRRRHGPGCPRVSVPVLSKMTTSSSRARSSARRSLTSRPFRAPSEVRSRSPAGSPGRARAGRR